MPLEWHPVRHCLHSSHERPLSSYTQLPTDSTNHRIDPLTSHLVTDLSNTVLAVKDMFPVLSVSSRLRFTQARCTHGGYETRQF